MYYFIFHNKVLHLIFWGVLFWLEFLMNRWNKMSWKEMKRQEINNKKIGEYYSVFKIRTTRNSLQF